MKGNWWFCLDEVWSAEDGQVLQAPHPSYPHTHREDQSGKHRVSQDCHSVDLASWVSWKGLGDPQAAGPRSEQRERGPCCAE